MSESRVRHVGPSLFDMKIDFLREERLLKHGSMGLCVEGISIFCTLEVCSDKLVSSFLGNLGNLVMGDLLKACRIYVRGGSDHALLLLLLLPSLGIKIFAFATLPLSLLPVLLPTSSCLIFFGRFTPKAPVLTRGTPRGRSLAKTAGRP